MLTTETEKHKMTMYQKQDELDTSVMDKFIEKYTERIKCCVDTCFGVPNEGLKLFRYEELLEKAEKYDRMQPNISEILNSMNRLLEATKSTLKNHELEEARKEAIGIMHRLGR